jgi:hypothetical protein
LAKDLQIPQLASSPFPAELRVSALVSHTSFAV